MATMKDYSGALFRNTKEDEGSPNSPDYTGDLLLAGVRYRLAGWIKVSDRGKFLSLSVKPDEEIAEAPTTTCLFDVDHRSAGTAQRQQAVAFKPGCTL